MPTSGLANLFPFFAFSTHIEEDISKIPQSTEIEQFAVKIMQAMRLSNEVCLLALIFIERLLKIGKVQLLTINWKPIMYAAFLVAAKYWEDF